jgi:chromosome segregation ATPase
MVGMDLAQRLSEEIGGLWHQVGNLTRAVSIFEFRFDRIDSDIASLKADVSGLKADVSGLKTDVSGLKTDVSGLKTDVSGLKTDVSGLRTDVMTTQEQLNRLELAVHDQSNRMDAQFERLFGLIRRDELKVE